MHIKHDIILCTLVLCCVSACGDDDTAGDYGPTPIMDAGVQPKSDAATQAPPPSAAVDSATAAVGAKGYIGLFGDSAIGVVDIANRRVIKTLPVTSPDGLVITPDGKKVYVSSMDSGSVKVIDTATDTLRGSIDVGSKPAGLSVTPDGKLLVVAVGGSNEAVLVDTATDTITRHVPVALAHASCITQDSHFAYVGSQVTTAPTVVAVDLTTDAPPKVYPVDKPPRALACETWVYFSSIGLDAIESLDPTTGTLGPQIATGASPHDLRASGMPNVELVVSQTAGELEFFDTTTHSVIGKVATGKLAHWITLSEDHATAYVTNEGDDNMSVVDLATRSVIATVPVGKAPRKMALRF
jgi:YVTN family beta-propeller protein